MITVGIGLIFKPDLLFEFLKSQSNNLSLHIFAIVIRLFLGFLLIYFSEMSKYPLIMEVVGWVIILAAIVLILMGRKNFKRLIEWAATFFKPYSFIGGLLAIAFGGFLIYSFL